MKKLIILTLAIFTAVCFSACDDTDSSSDVIEVEEATTTASEIITTAPEVTTTAPVTTTVTTSVLTETQASETTAEGTTVTEATTVATTATKPVTTTAVTTTKPVTTTAPTTTTKPVTTTVPVTTTTAPVTTSAPASARQAGFQSDIQAECLRILNEYRAANGVPAISLDTSWQIYAERLSKFNADNNLISHGPTAIEIVYNPYYSSADTSATAIANFLMNGFKNSYAHEQSMLDIFGGETIRQTNAYCAVYYNPNTLQYSTVIVKINTSYQSRYNSYGIAISSEDWWEAGGKYTAESDAFLIERRSWTEQQYKDYFFSKGYQKYYPHLS